MEVSKTQLAFSMIPGMNYGLYQRLMTRIDSEDAFFNTSAETLKIAHHLPDRCSSDEVRSKLRQQAEAEEKFITANKIDTLYAGNPDFPSRLGQSDDCPAMLYRFGSTDLDSPYTIGIVGTRNATVYGTNMTAKIVEELAVHIDNPVIISGLAYGIDAAAHRAALKANLPTVGVCAHPLNTLYPAEHRNLAAEMVHKGGCLVSEYPTYRAIHRSNFLERNRIIAALSDAVIVVESDYRGGAMSTARLALEYGREVFAVPGRLTDRSSHGCNKLIANNTAHIYTDIDNLIEILGWIHDAKTPIERELPLDVSVEEQSVMDAIRADSEATLHDLTRATGIAAARMHEILFTLEIKGLIASCAGGKYAVTAT